MWAFWWGGRRTELLDWTDGKTCDTMVPIRLRNRMLKRLSVVNSCIWAMYLIHKIGRSIVNEQCRQWGTHADPWQCFVDSEGFDPRENNKDSTWCNCRTRGNFNDCRSWDISHSSLLQIYRICYLYRQGQRIYGITIYGLHSHCHCYRRNSLVVIITTTYCDRCFIL